VGNVVLPSFRRVPMAFGELLTVDSSGSPCSIQYESASGHGGALKNAKELLYGSRFLSIGFEGSMPPSEGIPPSISLLASNTSGGASRAWLEPCPCMGASLVVPDFVTRGQLSNPGQGLAFDPSRFSFLRASL
jgi:hypothetical protein